MNNLVIGNTSQLAYYFPEYYEKISSRNINYDYYKDKFYDRVFLCFAEQRTFSNLSQKDFYKINVIETMKVIDFFVQRCNNLIIYGTAELWNNHEGEINIEMPFNYEFSPYISSKEDICSMINNLRSNNDDELHMHYRKIIILHPFNFNSTYRKNGFLFSKIFDSIINKKIIEIGNTYFYRDLIHPKYVVERSILAEKDEIIGSGRLTYINNFIRDLYDHFNLDYEKYVIEKFDKYILNNRHIYYLKSKRCLYNYDDLLQDTLRDLYQKILTK
jgi:nucleoside-diphosphate-sugar epimerase